MEHFKARNVSSVVHWQSRMYRWEQVKAVPVEERMSTPFQRGNVCEDAERCETLAEKGGNPDEVICPKCPVYTECQQRGYLSQVSALQDAKVQIVAAPGIFFNPESQEAELWEALLQGPNETERLCVVDTAKVSELFPIYGLSKDVLEAWIVNYQGHVLGDFARFLLNAIEIKGTPDSSAVRRVRAAFRAFTSEADTLVEQMCQVNVRGSIMSMSEAIALGIFDTTTVESIQALPAVCRNPNWTFWHQLKFFFDYYTRDADAPMLWDEKVLWFCTPPVLHPSVKRLLLMAAHLSERHLCRAFADNGIEVISPESATWSPGNRLFQICTGNYTLETIIDYDNTWNALRLSEAAQRFFLGIRAEIERDPNVKHTIITHQGVIPYLEDFSAKENVCLVSAFNETREFASTLKAADVLWVVGAPYWAEGIIWHRSQILFGNDELPLSYEKRTNPMFTAMNASRVFMNRTLSTTSLKL